MTKIFFIFTLLLCTNLMAQKFLNGNFEIHSLSNDAYNLSNSAFDSIIPDVHSFGPNGNIDINRGPAQSGKWSLGITSQNFDLLSLKLSHPLVKGKYYKISFYHLSVSNSNSKDTIDIGLSSTKNSCGVRIYSTTTRNGVCGWIKKTCIFQAPNNGQYISVKLRSNYVFIDNFLFECPDVNLGNDIYACTGENHILDAFVKNAKYLWQDASTDSVYIVSKPGKYWVEVSKFNCTTVDSIEVFYNPYPTVNLGNDLTLCTGDSIIIFSSTSGSDYYWSSGSKDSSILVDSAGVYWLDLTLDNCTSRDSITVKFQAPPPLDLGTDTFICEGNQHLLGVAPKTQSTYLWNSGATTSTIITKVPGVYWLQMNNSVCTVTDTMELALRLPPKVNIGNDTSICAGQLLKIQVEDKYDEIIWSTFSTEKEIYVTDSGLYWVRVIDKGCAGMDSITISLDPIAKVELGKDSSICQGDSIIYYLNEPGVSYYWSDGSRQNQFIISQSGMYSVRADKGDCSAYDSIKVRVNQYPNIDLGRDTVICLDSPYDLHVADLLSYIEWQDGSADMNYQVNQSDTIWVMCDYKGCITKDTIVVEARDCVPSLSLPNVFSPNGDGINDLWFPIYQNLVKEVDLKVVDRTGRIVYKSNEVRFQWDGALRNELPAPDAIYFYVLNYKEENDSIKNKKGTIHLFR